MNGRSVVVRLTNSGQRVRLIDTPKSLAAAMSVAGITWLADTTQVITVIGPDGETKRVWPGFHA